MRAIVFDQHGGPEVLQYREDIPVPEPQAEEVRVRVAFAALNRLDDFVRTGWRGLHLSFPHILGADFCGTVDAIGPGVSDWAPGQRVVANPTLWCGHCHACVSGWHNRCEAFAILGEHVSGAFGEFVCVPARNLVGVPDVFPDDLAAAAPLAGVTAWHMLITSGGLCAGETLLVVGAGGGVNTFAIQIARLAGATIFVIAGNSDKADGARTLGASWVHNRAIEPGWARSVWQATGKRGVDVVVDNVGAATWTDSLRCLARGGRLLTVGGTSGYEAATPINLLFGRHLRIVGSTMGTQSDFDTVMGQVFAGRLVPRIDRVYPLPEYPAALARLLSGEAFGKILLCT
jgi:NADPH:quinone reductase-like Zn-dependent oxidoreductase